MAATTAAPVAADPRSLKGRDLLTLKDFSGPEIRSVLDRARELKDLQRRRQPHRWLEGRTLAMIFEKPSLRTRCTFETGMTQLGGHAIDLAAEHMQMGTRESVPDVARNLERWVDAIMARVFVHRTVETLAEYARVPVINGLSDLTHPCQILADLQTIEEHKGRLSGLKISYIGDGFNITHSLLFAAAALGLELHVATPPDYEPNEQIVAQAERAERQRVFPPYQVNSSLVSLARPDAIVMHCLPAHRGEEITDDVMDGSHSVVFDQAENRLHAQKAVLTLLVGTD